jgi:hypothetical protein
MAATSPEHASAASKQAVHKIDAAYKGDAAFKGNAANKGPTMKANAVSKSAVSKQGVDPSSRRGREAS